MYLEVNDISKCVYGILRGMKGEEREDRTRQSSTPHPSLIHTHQTLEGLTSEGERSMFSLSNMEGGKGEQILI